MPEEAHIVQWRQRTEILIAKSSQTREALERAKPQFQRASAEYLRAVQHYAIANAREDERYVLLDFGRRAGQRSVHMVRRHNVSQNQVAAEEDLRAINRSIFWVQATIGIGKLAEAGLGVYAWFPKVNQGFVGMKGFLLDNQGLEVGRLRLDAAKALQPFGAAMVEAATVGPSSATPEKAAVAAGQLIAVLLRIEGEFKAAGSAIWNHLATIRRARNMNDAWTAAAAIFQLMKTALDNLKSFIDLVENYNREAFKIESPNRSGMATAVGRLSALLGIFRDLAEAGKAFVAAYDVHLEMKAGLDSMERQIAEGERYIGSTQEAIANLPSLRGLSPENVDELMANVTDMHTARVMADEARQEAERIMSDIAAAATFRREQTTRLRSETQQIQPHIKAAEEDLRNLKRMINEMGWVVDRMGINRGPQDVAAARELGERLTIQRDLLTSACLQFQFAGTVR